MKFNRPKTPFNLSPSRILSRTDLLYYLIAALLPIAMSHQALSAEASPPATFSVATPEADPIAFRASYIGLVLNQNHPWSYGRSTWSSGGPSWGGEYRFFYKDRWTLAISGEFKQLLDLNHDDKSLFSFSQETMRLVRVYYPWYLAVGGRLSNFVPVRKIAIPYERDQSRAIDSGAALSVAAIWITSQNTAVLLSANRWRSLSTTKKQGVELLLSTLVTVR